MNCPAPTSAHDGMHVRRYVVPATRGTFVLCDGCVTRAREMGLGLIEDRRLETLAADRKRPSGPLARRRIA